MDIDFEQMLDMELERDRNSAQIITIDDDPEETTYQRQPQLNTINNYKIGYEYVVAVDLDNGIREVYEISELVENNDNISDCNDVVCIDDGDNDNNTSKLHQNNYPTQQNAISSKTTMEYFLTKMLNYFMPKKRLKFHIYTCSGCKKTLDNLTNIVRHICKCKLMANMICKKYGTRSKPKRLIEHIKGRKCGECLQIFTTELEFHYHLAAELCETIIIS